MSRIVVDDFVLVRNDIYDEIIGIVRRGIPGINYCYARRDVPTTGRLYIFTAKWWAGNFINFFPIEIVLYKFDRKNLRFRVNNLNQLQEAQDICVVLSRHFKDYTFQIEFKD